MKPDPDPGQLMAVILLIPAWRCFPFVHQIRLMLSLGMRRTRLLVATSHFAENATHIIKNCSNSALVNAYSERQCKTNVALG